MSFTNVTLTGTVELQPGVPAPFATVSATLSSEISDGATVIEPFTNTATCNASGVFSLGPLPANDDSTTTPVGTYYTINIAFSAGPDSVDDPLKVIVPHASAPSVDLFSLARLGNAPAPSTPYVVSVNGMNGVVTVGGDPQAGTSVLNPVWLAPVLWVYENLPRAGRTIDPYTYTSIDGSGVGDYVTQNTPADGVLSIDGGSPSPGDRVAFCPANDNYAYAGIYTVTAVGDGSSVPWVLTRATDNDTAATLLEQYWAVVVGSAGTGTVFGAGSTVRRGYVTGTTVGSDLCDLMIAAYGAIATGIFGSTASGFGSTASGFGSTASGQFSIASGQESTASGQGSIASGQDSTASGQFSTASGGYSTASGQGSTASGLGSTASGQGSIASGLGSTAYGDGQAVDASGPNSQASKTVSGNSTGDATPTALENSAGQLCLIRFVDPSGNPVWDKTLIVTARVAGRRTDVPGTDSAWSFQGVLRGDGTSAYSWVGGSAPTAVVIAQDAAASSWDVDIDIGTDPLPSSAAALIGTVTGEVGNSIAWECTLELDEVAG